MAFRRSPSPSSDDSNDVNDTESNNTTNIFRNDGSFLEMFKKMQNASQTNSNQNSTKINVKTSSTDSEKVDADVEKNVASKPPPFVGRRRCMKALPVGKVKKLKTGDDSNKSTTTDAWAKYLEEVKKYKETYCDGESKNRSLVK